MVDRAVPGNWTEDISVVNLCWCSSDRSMDMGILGQSYTFVNILSKTLTRHPLFIRFTIAGLSKRKASPKIPVCVLSPTGNEQLKHIGGYLFSH